MIFSDNKGILNSLVLIVVVLVLIGVTGVFAMTIWNAFNDQIQLMPEDQVNNVTKQKVDNLTSYLLYDKIFVAFFIVLIIGFLITSATLPVDKPFFLLLLV